MKIQDTFGDISKTLGKKWRKIFNKEENAVESIEDGEKKGVKAGEAEGSFSMTQGDHGTIFGLSRPVVTGIGVFFFVVFAAAFFYASSNDSSKQHTQQTQQQAKESDIANPNRLARSKNENAADDYGELARINAAKNGKNGQNPNNLNGQNPNNPNGQGANAQNPNMQPAQAVRAQPMPPSSVPAVPRPSVVVPAAGAYPQQVGQVGQAENDEVAREREEERSAAERLKEKLKSAIAFAFDGGAKGAAASKDAATNESGSTQASPSVPMGRGAAGLMQTSASSAPVYSEPTERTVMAGTIIPAMLITGINTDAPGPVIAQVMADVYDIHGRTLILPAGSRVLGTMGNSGSTSGTTGRIGVTFDTVVLPNGGAWNIGQSIMAVDGAGYAGLSGQLHRHTGSNLMKGLFNSALTALSTASVDRVTFDASALTSLTEQQAPTATVAPGYSFNLYVTANIAF